MTTKMLTPLDELRSPEPMYPIGGSTARSGSKSTRIAIVIAAIGLQPHATPSIASTETRFYATGDAMPTGNSACRSKFATALTEFSLTPEQLEAIEETAEILADPVLMAMITQSNKEIASGKTEPWDSVKAKLGL